MKIWMLAFLIALAAITVTAQQKREFRFCPANELQSDVLLMICTHERGMAPLIQPRLYFKVNTSGLAEYEVGERQALVTKSTRLSEPEVSNLKEMLALPEMLEAAGEYPAHRHFIDSSLETNITLRTGGGQKSVRLRNFMADDYDIASRYPAVLVLLMQTVTEYRDRAMGVVKQIPQLSFDGMVNSPDYSTRREIVIYADYEHRYTVMATGKVLNARDALFDHEGSSGLEVAMEFAGRPEDLEAYKAMLARTKEERFGRRGRILVRGRYNVTVDPMSRSQIRKFYAVEVKSIVPIDLPYRGEIELGWNYSDTFDHAAGATDVTLSTPLKMPMHHAVRIEWTNLNQFPRILKAGRRSIVFRANSRTIQQVTPGRWNETYHVTILEAH